MINALEFPQLVTSSGIAESDSNKRNARFQSLPSAKRHKMPCTLNLLNEDDSWIDNFSFLDSLFLDTTACDFLGNIHVVDEILEEMPSNDYDAEKSSNVYKECGQKLNLL